MDPSNPVISLCTAGMAAEQRGEFVDALVLFEQAWAIGSDDYERCIAAHYLARLQDGPVRSLEWNERCLELAIRVDDERVHGFYPSMHLNIGRSHEELGDLAAARHSYEQAKACQAVLGGDPYGEMLRDGIARALQRVERT